MYQILLASLEIILRNAWNFDEQRISTVAVNVSAWTLTRTFGGQTRPESSMLNKYIH